MKGFFTLLGLFLVTLAISQVLAQESESKVAHVRSKRSPDGGLTGALLLGKSFLLGSLLGPKIFRGRGWGPPPVRVSSGWGWAPPSRGWSAPSQGWGWSGPVVTVSKGWGW